MIKVNKEINLDQLTEELNGQGLVAILDENGKIVEIGLADDVTATESQLSSKINAHVAQNTISEKIEAKAALLEKLGITEDEAKLLLS